VEGQGDGSTIVLVHGAWHGAWCWDGWRPILEEAGLHVVVVELPGHDRPGSGRRLWTPMASYVAALDAVLETIGPECVVVGHSMGGLVVQRTLERRTVRRAVLLASVPRRGALGATVRQLRGRPATTLRAIALLDLWPLVATPDRARRLFFRPGSSAATVAWTAERLQNESYVAYLSMILRWPRPSKVATPVTVIAAEDDGVFTMAEQRSLAAAYGVDLVALPAIGHDAMLDDGAPAAARRLVALLAATP
jgi:pimeloyl-ACP methyl ester carboxylesterase